MLGPDGCEFLLAFPDGSFSESSTFLLSEVFARTPKVVLSKNFGVTEDAFDRIPKEQLFIFEAPVPGPIESDVVPNPLGAVPLNMISRAADQTITRAPGGTVRIVDTGNFPIATEVAAAIVEVAPNSMREIHWHPNADEWQYYISGSGRMTVFASQDSSRTFDFRAGDVGYVPKSMSHYIENTGDLPLKFLELFRSSRFQDVSLNHDRSSEQVEEIDCIGELLSRPLPPVANFKGQQCADQDKADAIGRHDHQIALDGPIDDPKGKTGA
jgi:oxalate decarboxylase